MQDFYFHLNKYNSNLTGIVATSVTLQAKLHRWSLNKLHKQILICHWSGQQLILLRIQTKRSFTIYLKFIWNLFEIYLKFIWNLFDIYLTFIWHLFNIYLIFFCCLFYIYWILFGVQRVVTEGHRFKSCFWSHTGVKVIFVHSQTAQCVTFELKVFFYWMSLKRFFINMWSFHPIFD